MATALRTADVSQFIVPELAELQDRVLVPMYRIERAEPVAEVAGAVALVGELMERLRRLAQAYGEWREFDAGAYFDLTPAQLASLLYLRERVSTVHVRFNVDLLLPSFQDACRFWAEQLAPAQGVMRQMVVSGLPDDRLGARLRYELPMQMEAHWQRASAVLQAARAELADDITYMSMRGAAEERMRWQSQWQRTARAGFVDEMLPPMEQIPSLTLVFDFPLPPIRQSGRLRRLRRKHERRRKPGTRD